MNSADRPIFLVIACCVAVSPVIALAKSSDRSQQLQVDATSTSAFQGPNSKSILRGNVKIVQGTILVTGDNAELYTGSDSRISRVVVTGKRAHVEQQDDKGQLLKADANRVDYDLTSGRAVLTGSAQVTRVDSSTLSASKITYNVDDSTCQAEGDEHEDVHMILTPKRRDAPAENR